MSVTQDDVLRIARLAELEVDEESLPALVEQMSRILDYVAQLSAATTNGGRSFPNAELPCTITRRPMCMNW